MFDTNAVGLIRVTQAALPLLEQSDNPVVVNVSSALGSFWAVTNPDRRQFHFPSIIYGASKAAVSMLTVQYAKSLPYIKFNAVEPGFTATDLTPFSGAGQPVEAGRRGHRAHGHHRPGRPHGHLPGGRRRTRLVIRDMPSRTLAGTPGDTPATRTYSINSAMVRRASALPATSRVVAMDSFQPSRSSRIFSFGPIRAVSSISAVGTAAAASSLRPSR